MPYVCISNTVAIRHKELLRPWNVANEIKKPNFDLYFNEFKYK